VSSKAVDSVTEDEAVENEEDREETEAASSSTGLLL